MKPHCEEGDLFYMGAQTVWLPAEHFMDINNWDDSLKPAASYYIKQVEEWIAKEECAQENESRSVANEERENYQTKSVFITTPDNDVDESSHSEPHLVGGATSYACNQCGKKLASKQSLIQHLRLHSGKKPFTCSQCGKTFSTKCGLTQHNRIHLREKPFACNQCDKKLASKHSLTQHLRIHSGEKPFVCGECEKEFARRSDLINHFRNCCGEKPFACSLCGKTFAEGSDLTRHMRIHSFVVWKGI